MVGSHKLCLFYFIHSWKSFAYDILSACWSKSIQFQERAVTIPLIPFFSQPFCLVTAITCTFSLNHLLDLLLKSFVFKIFVDRSCVLHIGFLCPCSSFHHWRYLPKIMARIHFSVGVLFFTRNWYSTQCYFNNG